MDSPKYTFLLVIVFILSCGGSNTVEIKNEDGKVVEKYSVNKESIKHGAYESYHENGKVQEKAQYENGQLIGKREIYSSEGFLEISENYVDNKLDGAYKVFHPNGQEKISSTYTQGMLNGVLRGYTEEGKLKEEVTFKENEENGPFKEYFANGKVEWEGTYLNGDNEFGLLKNYNEEGTLVKKMMCDSLAVCRTIWTLEKGDITPKY